MEESMKIRFEKKAEKEENQIKKDLVVIMQKLDEIMLQSKTYLTVEECASYMKVDDKTIRKYLRKGYLKGTRPTGGRWLVSRKNLESFIENGICSANEKK